MSPGFLRGPRTQAGLVLGLVAIVGALAGVLGERLVAQQRAYAPDQTDMPLRLPPDMMGRGPLGPQEMRRPGMRQPRDGGPSMRATAEARFAERLSGMLDLSPEQQLAIDSIMVEQRRRVRQLTAEVEPRFREIAQETRRNVEAVLTPDQLEQMRTMRRQRLRR